MAGLTPADRHPAGETLATLHGIISGTMLPPVPRRVPKALLPWLVQRLAREVVHGQHNINYILPLGSALLLGIARRGRVKYRVPRETVKVVPRIWSEAEVLRAISPHHLPTVPRFLRSRGIASVHEYVQGWSLNLMADPPGTDHLMDKFADFFVRVAKVPGDELPERPRGWPEDRDCTGFLHWLIDFADDEVRRGNQDRFGALFRELGVPESALGDFKRRHTGLAERPFRLLHTDVHRANVVVIMSAEISVIDWELALYGDPLHELATHLVRMGYDKDQQEAMVERWTAAMRAADLGELVLGIEKDLPVYLDFEYAQSVYPDVMRAVLELERSQMTDGDVRAAVLRVESALALARDPLKLVGTAPTEVVEKALRNWVTGEGR